jgi:hypothetical protein
VRKFISICLACLIWAGTSGVLFVLHHSDTHSEVRHDASTCALCVAKHAPMAPAEQPAPALHLLVRPDASQLIQDSFIPQRVPRTTACRGPPVC